MNTMRPHYELGLAARGLFEIPDMARIRITCTRGSLWVTLDNDRRDIILEAGDSFVCPDHRRALVFAFEPSSLALHPEAQEPLTTHAPSISFTPHGALA